MRVRVLAAAVALFLCACDGDEADDASREAPLVEQPTFPVQGYYESSATTFDSLSELRDKSAVIAIVDVLRARDGEFTSADAPDGRNAQRILDVVVVEPLKGTERGDQLSVWESSWDLVPQGRDREWMRVRLMVTTDDYAIGPHDRVLIALVPDPDDSTLYSVQSVSSYFVIDPHDQESFKIIDRRNPVAAEIQERRVREVAEELRV